MDKKKKAKQFFCVCLFCLRNTKLLNIGGENQLCKV